jgi:hypothetical protein
LSADRIKGACSAADAIGYADPWPAPMLGTVKIGRRRLVPVDALTECLAQLMEITA